MAAEVSRDGHTLHLGLDACNGDNGLMVKESGRAVTVTVTTDDPPGGDDCMDGVRVRLRTPLDDRRVIDGSSGQAVAVSTRQ
jgi:hypothetical protein